MFLRKSKAKRGTCSPSVQQAHAEREAFEKLAAEIDAAAPARQAQKAEAATLRQRGEASIKQNHFGETLELAMRNRKAAH